MFYVNYWQFICIKNVSTTEAQFCAVNCSMPALITYFQLLRISESSLPVSNCANEWQIWESQGSLNFLLICDRRSAGHSLLVSITHLSLKTRYWLPSDIYGFLLVAPSLNRGQVCDLLLLGLASDVNFGSKSSRIRDYILQSHFRLGSFSVASYGSQDYCGGILTYLLENCCHLPDVLREIRDVDSDWYSTNYSHWEHFTTGSFLNPLENSFFVLSLPIHHVHWLELTHIRN
jgi:hypothetical protein